MSNELYSSPPFSRASGRESFEPLNRAGGDATINIPLNDVAVSNGSPVKNGTMAAPRVSFNEKRPAMQRRGVRKSSVFAQASKAGLDGDEDTVTRMGLFYDRVLGSSVIVRYFIYTAPVALVLAIPIIIGATGAKNAYIGGVRMMWVFVWLLVCWAGLWTSKVVTHFLPAVFQAVSGVVSSGTRKHALILAQLEIPLSLVGWALVSLATFMPIMTRNPEARASSAPTPHWVSIVQRILAAAMIAALVFAVERLFIQLITVNYHRTQFQGRIKTAKRQLLLLGMLYDASRAMFPTFCPEFIEEDSTISAIMDLALRRRHKKHGASRSGSSTPGRILQDIGNLGDKVSAAFGDIAQEVTGKTLQNPNSGQSIVSRALEKNRSSEAIGRRLWLSFVIEGQDALYVEDLIEVLGPERQAEAEECFAMLDRDENSDVSLDETIQTLTQFGRERSSVDASMHQIGEAIKVLDRMLCVVILIIIIFVFVAFLNASFVTTLATAGTALLSLSFVFSATAQEVLGSCIFLFVKHPYDIGDRVDLNTGADQMIVEHISLLFTVFRRINSHRTVQIPNIVLNSLWVENVSRSNAMKEQLSIFVSFDTTLEDIQFLRGEMTKFVSSKENSRDFQDNVEIEVIGVHEMNKLELSIDILHKSNWANETVRAARRSKFMCALVLALRKVPIYGPGGGDAALGSSDNPSYSVAVSDSVAASSRDKAARDKEGKRLVPTKEQTWHDGLGAPREMAVVAALNERSPALDGARDAGSSRNLTRSATAASAAASASPAPSSTRFAETANALDGAGSAEAAGFGLSRTNTQGRRKSQRSARGAEPTTAEPAGGPGTYAGQTIPSIGITAPSRPSTSGSGAGTVRTVGQGQGARAWDEERGDAAPGQYQLRNGPW